MSDLIKTEREYIFLFNELKEKIRIAQLSATLAVNREVIGLYWYIGKQILEKQKHTQWGSKLIETLSHDLLSAFPETRGFSARNIQRMAQFAQLYILFSNLRHKLCRNYHGGHIVLLIQKLKSFEECEWYAP